MKDISYAVKDIYGIPTRNPNYVCEMYKDELAVRFGRIATESSC